MCKIYLCIFSAFEDSETVYTDDISLYGMLIKVLYKSAFDISSIHKSLFFNNLSCTEHHFLLSTHALKHFSYTLPVAISTYCA